MARKQIEITPENKCSFCTGSKCCTYVTQAIETPRSKAEFEHLLWQVSHRDVEVYKDDDGWFLMFNTPCLHLRSDGGCGIYEARPTICREHSNDFCEYDEPAEKGFDLYFPDHDTLLTYCRKRFKSWDKRKNRGN
ncbi:YkgJ family cysteine cluster protein [Thiohalomonas denitrificans]|uniref:Uncharacterized protein n=1 Tax=Thiohalomonas denitrificans TaxID=415747 RepID=A0A1G5QWK4_9GAMM|nr:YkgJ family cysteine cluster protein [Thiohalomonas denitrificans]SCZ66127.1 hypothetical protein SAMN03097708_02912 [Thiohalomonas denitrificans]